MQILQIDPTAASMPAPNAGGQAAFCADWVHRYVALEGGWGAGKTWAGARKLLTLHIHNAFDAGGQVTGVPSAVIAPTYGNALDFALPALLEACEEAGLTVHWLASRSNLVIEDLGQPGRESVIMVRTADNPERIAGWEVGAFWCDEAARWKADRSNPLRDPLTQIRGRLRHPRARLRQGLFTYTNEGDHTAVYELFHRGDEDYALYRAGTRQNPAVRSFYEDQLRQLSELLKKQYLDGQAISLRGAKVYSQFDSALHVSEQVRLRADLPLQLAVDFNLNPGMHGQVGQYLPQQDRFVVTHELYGPRMDVRGLVRAFEQLVGRLGGWQWPELHLFGDATGRSEWAGTSESCYAILRQGLDRLGMDYRLRVPRSNPPVTDRVDAFNSALLSFDGQVHWQCHPRCTRLIDDLQKLRRGDDGLVDKSNPELSHASDAESYRVHYLRPLRVNHVGPMGRLGV